MQRALQAAATYASMQQLVQIPWCGLLAACNLQYEAAAAQLLPLQQQPQQARLIRTKARPHQHSRESIAQEATDAEEYHAAEKQPATYAYQQSKASSSTKPWQQQERWQQQQQQRNQDWEGPPPSLPRRQHQRPKQQQQQQQQRQRSEQAQGQPGQQQQRQQQRGDQANNARRQTSRTASAGTVWQGISNTSSSSSNAGAGVGTALVAMTPALLTRAISATSSLPELQQLLNQHKDTLQQINVCAAFKALVRLAGAAGSSSSSSSTATALAVMRHLSNRMLQQMRVARPWDLATAAWACSKLSFSEPRLLNAIAQEATRKAPILTPQDIAQLASAYARLAYKQPQLLELLAQQAVRQAAAFKPWALIHTAWSLHVSGTDARPLLEECGQQLPQQLAGLQPLDVATLLWLLAACDMQEQQQLVAAAAEQLKDGIGSYPPAAAAQAVVSLAGLGYRDSQLAEAAAGVMIQRLAAQLEQQQQELGEEADQQAHPQQQQQQQQQQRYGPKQVAHATFGLVRLGSNSQALLDAASAAFLAQPRGYSPALLCMLCWAFVQAGAAPAAAFSEAFAGQCLAQLPRFSADQVASIIRALHPTSRWPGSPQLLAAAYTQLPRQLPRMSTPVLSKLIVTLSKQQHAARKAQQQEQQQQLQVLLQQCGQEWLARSGSQGERLQAVDVATALRAAGLQELAAAVAQGHGDDQAATEALQLRVSAPAGDDAGAAAGGEEASNNEVPAAGAAGSASWLDNFVATADADSKQ